MVKVIMWGEILKNNLKFSTFCNQSWYSGASLTILECCPQGHTVRIQIMEYNIFWTTKPFVSPRKLGMFVYHDPERKLLPIQGQCHIVAWNPNSEPFATRHGILVHHHEPESFVAIWDCCSQGHGLSEGWNLHGISSDPVTQRGVSCHIRQQTLFHHSTRIVNTLTQILLIIQLLWSDRSVVYMLCKLETIVAGIGKKCDNIILMSRKKKLLKVKHSSYNYFQ